MDLTFDKMAWNIYPLHTCSHGGGSDMSTFKAESRFGLMVAVVLAVLIMGGCAKTIKYSYDIKTSFSGLNSYKWEPSSAPYRQDALLETNVQSLADQILEKKGFNRTPEKPDLLVSMSYEHEITTTKYNYQLRMLTLNIYKSENNELIWRGTAFGPIHTDAASEDLRQAVQDVLSNFPPK
jgi:hypothetical protein